MGLLPPMIDILPSCFDSSLIISMMQSDTLFIEFICHGSLVCLMESVCGGCLELIIPEAPLNTVVRIILYNNDKII